MAGLVPAIHVLFSPMPWMPGTSSAKTRFALLPGHDEAYIHGASAGTISAPGDAVGRVGDALGHTREVVGRPDALRTQIED